MRRTKPPKNASIYKESERDVCNLCLLTVNKPLTKDHVPPQGSVIAKHTWYRYLFPPSGWQHSQNGIKFHTLCNDCNTRRLGRGFDLDLNAASAQAKIAIGTGLADCQITCDPGRIIRAVFGHLLAAKDHTPTTRPDEKMRAFFDDEKATSIGGLSVYYWAHPDKHTMWMVRDAAMVKPPVVFLYSLLIWYPFGFLITDAQLPNLNNMSDYLSTPGPAKMPLLRLPSGTLEGWLNTGTSVLGAPSRTSFAASYKSPNGRT